MSGFQSVKDQNMSRIYLFVFVLLSFCYGFAAELQTNSTYSADVPSWVTKNRIDKVTDKIQMFLEWDIHRVTVIWYKNQTAFEKAHGLGPSVLAVSRKNDNTVLVGPKIQSDNFDAVFGHELVHVISYQKYKDAIPKWLEEGLANYISKGSTVDYKYLTAHPIPADVTQLTHPFGGTDDNIRYHYMASQALAEMIAAKCDLKNLLRLSVGRKMESYLDTYCQIPDLNAAYQKWLKSKTPKT